MKKWIYLLTVLAFAACKQNTPESENLNLDSSEADRIINADHADWIVGHWKRVNDTAKTPSFEQWSKTSDTHYSGQAYWLQGNVRKTQEIMQLVKLDNENWVFKVEVPGEHGPIEFRITEFYTDEFICVNDSIDFPKVIHYWKDGTHLKAKIFNQEMEMDFDFVPIK